MSSAAAPLTQAEQEFQGEDDEESNEESREESSHSTLYIKLIREIIQFVQAEHSSLISDTDAQILTLFEAFSEKAQMFLTCLIMTRKDLKWHPIGSVLKLGERLKLDMEGVASVMTELCKTPGFAQDQISIDEALWCLTIPQLLNILGFKPGTRKAGLVSAARQRPDPWKNVRETLGKCIRINLDIIRLFRRLILTYYRCKLPAREGSGSMFEIIEGVGKRFGAFRPLMFDEPPFLRNRDALVEFELRTFSGQAAGVDNYLPIFDDILADIAHKNNSIADTCRGLDLATRHVLASIVLQQHTEVSYSDLRELRCNGVFNPENDSTAVLSTFCGRSGDALCTDESFGTAMDRLRMQDLKELAKKHHIKFKGAAVKTELIKSFKSALSQRRIDSSRSLKDDLMPDIITKLDELQKRRVILKPDVETFLDSCVRRYFGSRMDAPDYLARRPFRAMRRLFCERQI
ncbi:hypothetical protein K438DRAFT_1942845 [Mycena galopus ATCC 62051]|nr:hypothetical protein K438DRAFT_2027049 [Mycena galopus ATCC 62051]KAF8156275.1 hypothetical protein K438DRAFT_1942845 [Mycena galopus ATCC 62051]